MRTNWLFEAPWKSVAGLSFENFTLLGKYVNRGHKIDISFLGNAWSNVWWDSSRPTNDNRLKLSVTYGNSNNYFRFMLLTHWIANKTVLIRGDTSRYFKLLTYLSQVWFSVLPICIAHVAEIHYQLCLQLVDRGFIMMNWCLLDLWVSAIVAFEIFTGPLPN